MKVGAVREGKENRKKRGTFVAAAVAVV